jgi:hypothetical protein
MIRILFSGLLSIFCEVLNIALIIDFNAKIL